VPELHFDQKRGYTPPAAFKRLLRRLGWGPGQLADELCVSPRTVDRFLERGSHRPSVKSKIDRLLKTKKS
jgi:hypothetical protein